MRVAVRSVDLAFWKTRNFVFFAGVVAMNYTIMRPSPVDLIFLSAVMLCFIVNQAIRANFVVLTLLLTAWGLSFFVASVPHLGEPNVNFELLAKSFSLMIGLLACYVSTSWTRRNYETFMKVYIVACVIASILGTIGFATGSERLTWDERARGFLDDPNMYGSMLVPSVLFCIYLIHHRIGSRALLIAALPVLGVGVMLSFSRAAIAALLLTLFGYVFFLNRLHLKRLVPAVLGLAAVAIVLFLVFFLSSQEFSQKFLQRLTFAESYDLGREGRYGRYLLVLPMILDNPMGLGVLELEKIFPEPIHNIFLSSFINYGWTGGVTWLVLFFSSIVLSVENYRRTRSPIAVLLMFTFLAEVMCATLHEGEHWRHLWLMMGLLWGFSQANFTERMRAAVPEASPPPRRIPPRPVPAVARRPAIERAAV